MSRSPASTVSELAHPAASAKEAERVRGQLEKLLSSSHFRSSRRCHILLQHITERALAGDVSELFKERSLGVAVFGREPTYDTNQDPVVRSTAGEIRKKLAQYYQEPGHEGEIKFALLPGSYIPEFQFPHETVSESPVRHRRHYWPLLASLGLLLLLGVVAVLYQKMHRSPLEQFWARAFESPGGVLMCLGQPGAFNLRSDRRQQDVNALLAHASTADLNDRKAAIPLGDLIAMPDRYVAYGDAACLVSLTSLLERHGTQYHIRGSSSTSFADLRERPVVLIGAFDNEWTLRLVGQVRYTFYKDLSDPHHVVEVIRDREHPDRSDWQLTDAWPEWNIPYDYALISRVFEPSTDRMAVVAAGIAQYGTVAAGEFLTNPDYFSQALSKLPSDWAHKNLQIVLKVPVVHGASGRPHVLATHVW
jgi:hypothetical protein